MGGRCQAGRGLLTLGTPLASPAEESVFPRQVCDQSPALLRRWLGAALGSVAPAQTRPGFPIPAAWSVSLPVLGGV